MKFQPSEGDNQVTRATERMSHAAHAWHVDRLEWVNQALRGLGLVNAGGAVAIAAFLGASRGTISDTSDLILSLKAFSVGLLAITAYPVYRFLWAEMRVWYFRWKRPRIVERLSEGKTAVVMVAHPPTRWQLAWTYLLCIGALVAFAFGLYIALNALPEAIAVQPHVATVIQMPPFAQLGMFL